MKTLKFLSYLTVLLFFTNCQNQIEEQAATTKNQNTLFEIVVNQPDIAKISGRSANESPFIKPVYNEVTYIGYNIFHDGVQVVAQTLIAKVDNDGICRITDPNFSLKLDAPKDYELIRLELLNENLEPLYYLKDAKPVSFSTEVDQPTVIQAEVVKYQGDMPREDVDTVSAEVEAKITGDIPVYVDFFVDDVIHYGEVTVEIFDLNDQLISEQTIVTKADEKVYITFPSIENHEGYNVRFTSKRSKERSGELSRKLIVNVDGIEVYAEGLFEHKILEHDSLTAHNIYNGYNQMIDEVPYKAIKFERHPTEDSTVVLNDYSGRFTQILTPWWKPNEPLEIKKIKILGEPYPNGGGVMRTNILITIGRVGMEDKNFALDGFYENVPGTELMDINFAQKNPNINYTKSLRLL
ncbi:hypothetical protein [Aureibacter tunicatorum]|uniref:Uncharacterized protein n=1 Tax=Aureibacter tunicatorum TaxID=866807 RepID=A0AAE3XPN9_9BACT|nr:hypothetical protein [Aureibacter tunicatorum]MDR6240378.1 hypothetical protein [Aureibacter tunicatorum]